MHPPPRRYHPIITPSLENAPAERLNFVLAKRAKRAEQHAMSLRATITRVDATDLFAALDLKCWDKLQLAGHCDSLVDKLRFAWVSKMGYLAGLATTGLRSSDPVTSKLVEDVLAQLAKVYEAWNARHYMESVAEACEAIGERLDRTAVSLGDERDRRVAAQRRAALYTRFGAGNIGGSGLLALHGRVAIAVFGPQRDRYCSEIGFCPSDLVRAANTYARLEVAGTGHHDRNRAPTDGTGRRAA